MTLGPHTLRFETAALAAAAAVTPRQTAGDRMADCLFCKIVAGEIPAKIVKRTADAVAFHDIDPKAPVHVLVIPDAARAGGAEREGPRGRRCSVGCWRSGRRWRGAGARRRAATGS